MAKKLVVSLIMFNVVALGLLIKDHCFAPSVSAIPLQMGGVNGAVVTASDEILSQSLDYADMPGMAVTANFPGGNLVILFSAEAFTRNGASLEIRAQVDGKETEPGDVTITTSPLQATGSFMFVAPGIAPGTHTVKIQWHKGENQGRELRVQDRTLVAFTVGQ